MRNSFDRTEGSTRHRAEQTQRRVEGWNQRPSGVFPPARRPEEHDSRKIPRQQEETGEFFLLSWILPAEVLRLLAGGAT
jgi:hypothetical protein